MVERNIEGCRVGKTGRIAEKITPTNKTIPTLIVGGIDYHVIASRRILAIHYSRRTKEYEERGLKIVQSSIFLRYL